MESLFFGQYGDVALAMWQMYGLLGATGATALVVLIVWGFVSTLKTTCRFFGMAAAVAAAVALVVGVWLRVDPVTRRLVGHWMHDPPSSAADDDAGWMVW